MVRVLVFCAIACGIAAPVMAGERTPSSAARAIARPNLPVALAFPGHDGVLTVEGDFAVRFSGASPASVSLAEFDNSSNASFDLEAVAAADPVSPYAARDLRSLAAWRLTDGMGPTTTTAGGVYAVRDQLADYRKPRVFRPGPLSAMLVLRIDGKDESPPLSVGGGGVAAALWRMMPQ